MEKRYQIFISSTFADLEEERKGIMEAVIELNCFPAGMEMFPATDTEQFEYIKSIIDESDYYIVVIAGKYGSVAEDGISYTEKEFNYALSRGIPVLAFIKKDLEAVPASKIETDSQKAKKLDKFRKKAQHGRVVKFWNNPDELKYAIHSSLSREIKIHPRDGWIRVSDVEYERSYQESNERIDIRKLNDIIEAIRISIGIEVEYPEGEVKIMHTTIEEFLKFIGINLLARCTESEFIRMVNNFVEYKCLTTLTYESAAVLPSGLSLIKTKLYAYGLIDIKTNSATPYIYTELAKEVIKEIAK